MKSVSYACLMVGVCTGAMLTAQPVLAATANTAAGASDPTTEQPAKRPAKGKKRKPGSTPPAETPPAGTASAAGGIGANTGKAANGESGRLEGDIVVVGLKNTVKTARNVKRKAQQIVDVVMAQDIGKLPDKNVPEALARVPGVQLERDRGEGTSIRIRGLSDAMTTINGSTAFSGTSRTTFLNDIQSDLIAGIEVYKTRTPDQIEGSPTGVVNLSLRRPTDFKSGATYAINVKGDYNDQSRSLNPYGSVLVAYNGDTPLGQMGFMVNATYNHLQYNESDRFNNLPVLPDDPRQIIEPSTTPAGIYMPNRVGIFYRRGNNSRVGMNVSAQWRPDDRWKFTAESSFTNAAAQFLDDLFWIPITYSDSKNPPPTLTNIVVGPDGRLAQSLSATSIDPIGPGKDSTLIWTRNYTSRFQIDYITDRMEFTGWINYAKSHFFLDRLYHYTRFLQQPSFDVEFNTAKDPRGGMNIDFKNIDLMDPKNYIYIDGISQSRILEISSELEQRYDLKLNTDSSFIDWFKTGFRHASRDYERKIGERGEGNMRVPIASLPDYKLTPIGKGFQGTTTGADADWLAGGNNVIRRNWNAIRALAVATNPGSDLVKAYPDYDPFRYFSGNEESYAAYFMAHYNVKLLFPIEGTFGARLVNSLTRLNANKLTTTFESIDGKRPEYVTTAELVRSKGNYLDVLPSVNAILHFSPKLQLRAAWTYDVGRPSAQALNPATSINATNPNQVYGQGGNPNARATTTNKYDMSLEYYFGEAGSISLAAWKWRQDGYLQTQLRSEILPGYADPVLVYRPYNAGRGKFTGIEASATSFFTFLPGVLKSFGGTVNFTYNKTQQEYPVFDAKNNVTGYLVRPWLYTSKYVYNVIGFFERGGLNVRVAYNWRSKQVYSVNPYYYYDNRFTDPVERLDASINYDITKQLTLSVEASNLTRNGVQLYWNSRDIPQDIYYYARNFAASVRYKF
ncbi:TonB-dependent receptor [Sphingomonas metalli]|uniref:TonB-dependent receptor n=1 Tax=Sphingomonas metalli TaxID=1779358 RepID=A0A916TD32_9SPHN|nr:TonB-dependent receptor [Sphingomonas metalli]GGB38794.1 TonB-dependent receptor [Sphingomonas metalli]